MSSDFDWLLDQYGIESTGADALDDLMDNIYDDNYQALADELEISFEDAEQLTDDFYELRKDTNRYEKLSFKYGVAVSDIKCANLDQY